MYSVYGNNESRSSFVWLFFTAREVMHSEFIDVCGRGQSVHAATLLQAVYSLSRGGRV